MRLPVLFAALLGGAVTSGSVAASGDPLDSPAPGFMPIAEITTPIVDASRLDGAVKVLATIETADPATMDQVRADMPMVRAEMYAATLEFSRLYASGLRAVDAKRLGEHLSAAVRKSHPQVSRVLILRLQAQPA
ncbi:hypothetical protein [Sphingomonas quercus]|uniref:Uncharacterized protein n=1 Tax=Sphingomonas quercus TaxID=2842451 RepID=A0ABS6BN92_9SPHN|nr:hypothetical protein [Sphingomonas quercus]MBU3078655.1 hypothetical protein [Sphingomonas quercus]